MSDNPDDFMTLFKSGQIEKARALLEKEMIKAKTAPDSVAVNKDGTGKFTRKGKEVVQDEDGNWHFKKKQR